MMNIERWVTLTPDRVNINGTEQMAECEGKEFLTQLYRTYVKDYPKFFKMDILCRLGFIASELLLDGKDISGDKCSIILFNRSGSLANDKAYRKTIEEENYFPSPAIFVYTLPNIVTGEIAIRNKSYAETSFYLLDRPDGKAIEQIVTSSIPPHAVEAVCGWVECSDEDKFKATMFLLGQESSTPFNAENINKIINI